MKKLIISISLIILIVGFGTFLLVAKQEYNYKYNNYGNVELTLKDYKIIRILKSVRYSESGEPTKKQLILTNEEFKNIMKADKLVNPDEEGYSYIKENDFAKNLEILSHGNEYYIQKNLSGKEENRSISREYANEFFNRASKVYEFNIPKEYINAYFTKITGINNPDENVDHLVTLLKNNVHLLYKEYNSGKTYKYYVDIIKNEDDSVTIKYYGAMKGVFGVSFTQENALKKLDGTIERTVLKYDSSTDTWSKEIENK